MKVSIRCLEKKLSQILPLAEAYQRSYNKLSQGYKSLEEMALYTKGYFLKKLWKMAEDKDSVGRTVYKACSREAACHRAGHPYAGRADKPS